MRTELDLEAGVLTLGFKSRDRVRAFFERSVGEGGFLLHLTSRLGFRKELRLEATADDGFEFSCRAEVSGVSSVASGRFATAFLLHAWSAGEAERLRLALRTSPRQAEAEPAESEAADEEPAAAGETRGTSPIHRIRAMNPPQRTLLARKADRIERQILLKDNSAQVLQALLTNPRIESRDILQIVKSTHTNAPLLKRIVDDARWGKNQEILALVAKNPKTPSPVAVRLVDKLRTSDLRFMGKINSGLRENVRRAALREYLRRSGS